MPELPPDDWVVRFLREVSDSGITVEFPGSDSPVIKEPDLRVIGDLRIGISRVCLKACVKLSIIELSTCSSPLSILSSIMPRKTAVRFSTSFGGIPDFSLGSKIPANLSYGLFKNGVATYKD
jgi:hypothetical protein